MHDAHLLARVSPVGPSPAEASLAEDSSGELRHTTQIKMDEFTYQMEGQSSALIHDVPY